MTFTEKSPNSDFDVLGKREGFSSYIRGDGRPQDQTDYDIADASFDVFVPPKYSKSVPHGLFVFMSPGGPNVMPTWLPVFTRHKLIFVSVKNSGKEPYWHLYVARLALDAVHNLSRDYNIDPDRVYISGFSGGGMAATKLIHAFPDIFRGCFSLNGEDFYDGHWNEAGELEPGVMEFPRWHGDYDEIKKKVSLVLLTGRRDIVCKPEVTISNAQGLLLDGFSRTTLLIVPEGTHRHPDATWFERGIKALEAKPTTSPTTKPTTQPNPGADQIAQAKRYLATAQKTIDSENAGFFYSMTARHLETILKDYPTTPSAPIVRDLLEWQKKNIKPIRLGRPATQPDSAAK